MNTNGNSPGIICYLMSDVKIRKDRRRTREFFLSRITYGLGAPQRRSRVPACRSKLFSRFLQRPHRSADLAVIGLAPAQPALRHEVAAAHRVHDLGIVDPGRDSALLRQRPRRLQKPPPGG